MEDNRSMMSSVYWDAISITSESTIAPENFHTPTGSFIDLSSDRISNRKITLSDSGSVTPQSRDVLTSEDAVCQQGNAHDISVNEVLNDNSASTTLHMITPNRPPPIKLHKYVSVQIDSGSETPEPLKNWRSSFADRLLLTKPLIKQSKSEDGRRYQGVRNIWLRMRNSLKKFKSFDGTKFQSLKVHSLEGNLEGCSTKKVTNGSIVLYPIDEEKSIFDQCSTIRNIFKSETKMESSVCNIPKIIEDCLQIFLEVNKKQIDNRLLLVNQHLGCYLNLFSDNLDSVDKSKRYKMKPFKESKDVYFISDTQSTQIYVALKRTIQRRWVSITGFCQHLETEQDLFPGQTWICYEADSVTNMAREHDSSTPDRDLFKGFLDCLLHLLNILLCPDTKDRCSNEIKSTDVILISSNTSLICLLGGSVNTITDEAGSTSQGCNLVHEKYRQSLTHLDVIVGSFLSLTESCCHFISASYPLDYVFYLLMELHKHVALLDHS